MVYVSGGHVLESRSSWRFSIISEIFWGIINFIVLFFRTLINPYMSKTPDSHITDYRPPGSGPGGPPRPPRRRFGGMGGGGADAPDAPPMAGGG